MSTSAAQYAGGQLYGREVARGMRLALERVLVGGVARAGTDEETAAALLSVLDEETVAVLEGQMRRQAMLAPTARTARLGGGLVSLGLDEPVTAAAAMRDRLTRRRVMAAASTVAAEAEGVVRTTGGRLRFGPEALDLTQVSLPSETRGSARLTIDRLQVIESQDDWFRGRFNTTDETSLQVVLLDLKGDVVGGYHKTGSIDEGQQRDIDLDAGSVSIAGLPGSKPFLLGATVTAIEIDSGKYNDLAEKLVEVVREKVKVLVAGYISAQTGIPLPVAVFVVGFLDGYLDEVWDIITGWVRNDDDTMGTLGISDTVSLAVPSSDADWPGRTTPDSGDRRLVFSGADGRWQVTAHWTLVGAGVRQTSQVVASGGQLSP